MRAERTAGWLIYLTTRLIDPTVLAYGSTRVSNSSWHLRLLLGFRGVWSTGKKNARFVRIVLAIARPFSIMKSSKRRAWIICWECVMKCAVYARYILHVSNTTSRASSIKKKSRDFLNKNLINCYFPSQLIVLCSISAFRLNFRSEIAKTLLFR